MAVLKTVYDHQFLVYEVESVVCEIPSVYIRTDQVKSRDAIASKNYLNKKK